MTDRKHDLLRSVAVRTMRDAIQAMRENCERIEAQQLKLFDTLDAQPLNDEVSE